MFSFFKSSGHRRAPHSFPTRRSSDLVRQLQPALAERPGQGARPARAGRDQGQLALDGAPSDLPGLHRGQELRRGGTCEDRKSTRLNSSHVRISYAVFCLKKKRTEPSAGTSKQSPRLTCCEPTTKRCSSPSTGPWCSRTSSSPTLYTQLSERTIRSGHTSL